MKKSPGPKPFPGQRRGHTFNEKVPSPDTVVWRVRRTANRLWEGPWPVPSAATFHSGRRGASQFSTRIPIFKFSTSFCSLSAFGRATRGEADGQKTNLLFVSFFIVKSGNPRGAPRGHSSGSQATPLRQYLLLPLLLLPLLWGREDRRPQVRVLSLCPTTALGLFKGGMQ